MSRPLSLRNRYHLHHHQPSCTWITHVIQQGTVAVSPSIPCALKTPSTSSSVSSTAARPAPIGPYMSLRERIRDYCCWVHRHLRFCVSRRRKRAWTTYPIQEYPLHSRRFLKKEPISVDCNQQPLSVLYYHRRCFLDLCPLSHRPLDSSSTVPPVGCSSIGLCADLVAGHISLLSSILFLLDAASMRMPIDTYPLHEFQLSAQGQKTCRDFSDDRR